MSNHYFPRSSLARVRTWLQAYFNTALPVGALRRLQALSLASDALMTVALAGSLFFSISPGEARSKITAYLLFTMAPFAIMAPFVAPLLDRGALVRRKVVAGSALARIAAVTGMIFSLQSLAVFPLALISLVASKAYLVAKSSLVPEVVPQEGPDSKTFIQTNANLTLLGAVAGGVAAAIGAGILKTPFLGASWDLIVELIPLTLMLREGLQLLRPFRTQTRQQRRHSRPAPGPSGPGYATTLLLSLMVAAVRGQVGFFALVLAFALKNSHSPTWVYGAALASSTLGSALATQITPRLRHLVKESSIVAVSAGAIGVASVLAASSDPHRGAAIVLSFVIGIGAQSGKIAFDADVQHELVVQHYGRTFAKYESSFQLAWVLGALIAATSRFNLQTGESLLGTTSVLAIASYLIASAALRHSSGESAPPSEDW